MPLLANIRALSWLVQMFCGACLAVVVVPVEGAAFAPHGDEVSQCSDTRLQPNGNSTAFLQIGKTKERITGDTRLQPNGNSTAFLLIGKTKERITAAPDCLQNTGGTCAVETCAAWRGPVKCEHLKCFCPPQMCAGADGKCYSEPYKTLLPSVRIRNVRWPSMYMYLGVWGSGVYVGQDHVTPASSFKVRQLPDGTMLLSHNVHGEYVITVEHYETCDHENHHCTQTYEPTTRRIQAYFGAELSAVSLALDFTTAPDGQSLMINSLDHPGRYFYIPKLSWTVDTYFGDPGTSGYWQFDPPLPVKPQPFRGRRCSYDCGGSKHANPMSCMMVLSLLSLSFASLN